MSSLTSAGVTFAGFLPLLGACAAPPSAGPRAGEADTQPWEAFPKDVLAKNAMYDHAADAIWQLAVYDPVHDGWEFANMGGQAVLDHLGAVARLDADSRVVDLCCGMGATSRYLAEVYGCEVTGVDVNAKQIENARRRAAFSAAKDRLVFMCSDILAWDPFDAFDAALVMDSLMYVPDTQRALDRAYACLADSGLFVMSEIVAGPNLTEEVRRFTWEVDGFASLPTLADYVRMLETAGFAVTERVDLTPVAIACWETIYDALSGMRREEVELVGERELASWTEVATLYLRAFRERQLEYVRITAAK